MAAAVGYRIVARDVADGPITGTAFFWGQDEDGVTAGDPTLAFGVACEPGTTVTDDFWISPNIRKVCAWNLMGNARFSNGQATWGVVPVDYNTANIITTINEGKPDAKCGADGAGNQLNPDVTLVQYKISQGDIRDDELSFYEIERIALWCKNDAGTGLPDVRSAEEIMDDHGLTEVGPAH